MTAASNRSAISVRGLRKSFGDKVVLDGIDLDVRESTVFTLLGPNGAGKTTMVRILSAIGYLWSRRLHRRPATR